MYVVIKDLTALTEWSCPPSLADTAVSTRTVHTRRSVETDLRYDSALVNICGLVNN